MSLVDSFLSFMGLSRTRESRAVSECSVDYTGPSMIDQSGVTVRRVAGYPSVSQALQMIAGDFAKIPIVVYQVAPEGLEKIENHRVLDLVGLWGAPNEIDTAYDMLFDWVFQCLLWGSSAIWIERDGPDPIGLIPLLPDRTKPVYANGKRYFQTDLTDDTGARVTQILPDADVLYLEFLNVTGLGPENPVRLYRETFEQAVNAQDFTSNYFKGGTNQGGILMIPTGAGKTAIENVERELEQKRNDRSKWFKSLILKDGFRWQSTTSSLKDSTAVELDESTARQIARLYNIPPSQLGLADSQAYNSLFADRQRYIDSCLSTWLIQGRSQMQRKLLTPSEQRLYRVDHDIDQIAWADPETKAKIGMMGRQWGFIDVNTVRRWFGQRPLTPEEIAMLPNPTTIQPGGAPNA